MCQNCAFHRHRLARCVLFAPSDAKAMPCGSASAIIYRWGPTADLQPGFAVGEICFAAILG
jgi:hypothetical protein